MRNRFRSLFAKASFQFPQTVLSTHFDMSVLCCPVEELERLMSWLYADDDLCMNMLLDLCVVDRLHYGVDEWEGVHATERGYDRARSPLDAQNIEDFDGRFEMVYHLLSTSQHVRVRVKVRLQNASVLVPSMTPIWPNANWYEREAFDLFGIRFKNHPDLRRILTDYGFVGYPMRKDFPLPGRVEIRYDATLARCLYEPVTIKNRVSTPKVIRKDDQRLTIKD